jgi:small-conductance mechanosensitive channel
VAASTLALGTTLPSDGVVSPTLTSSCGSSPGIACRLVWDITHSGFAADFTDAYLAGPVRLALRIALVLAIAIALRVAARRVILRITSRTGSAHDRGESRQHAVFGERRGQRATALASLLGNAASVAIFSVAGLIVLGDIGVNLAPVLASAGVLGIALGFGAQNLVQDFLAGIFILLEDQYGVGDVVDIATVTGTVEAVSLRITRLRDVNGIVWHIRNGSIQLAGNETHGWARAVIDFPVPYGLPVAAARGALERAATAMASEARWRTAIIEPPEVWGVEEISPDLLLRVTARTAPMARTEVARELRERLSDALDAELAAAANAIHGATVPRQAAPAAVDAPSASTAGGSGGSPPRNSTVPPDPASS